MDSGKRGGETLVRSGEKKNKVGRQRRRSEEAAPHQEETWAIIEGLDREQEDPTEEEMAARPEVHQHGWLRPVGRAQSGLSHTSNNLSESGDDEVFEEEAPGDQAKHKKAGKHAEEKEEKNGEQHTNHVRGRSGASKDDRVSKDDRGRGSQSLEKGTSESQQKKEKGAMEQSPWTSGITFTFSEEDWETEENLKYGEEVVINDMMLSDSASGNTEVCDSWTTGISAIGEDQEQHVWQSCLQIGEDHELTEEQQQAILHAREAEEEDREEHVIPQLVVSDTEDETDSGGDEADDEGDGIPYEARHGAGRLVGLPPGLEVSSISDESQNTERESEEDDDEEAELEESGYIAAAASSDDSAPPTPISRSSSDPCAALNQISRNLATPSGISSLMSLGIGDDEQLLAAEVEEDPGEDQAAAGRPTLGQGGWNLRPGPLL